MSCTAAAQLGFGPAAAVSCRHLVWGGDGLSHAPSASLAPTSHCSEPAKAGPLLLCVYCDTARKKPALLALSLAGKPHKISPLAPKYNGIMSCWPGWLQFWGTRLYSGVATPCWCRLCCHESQVGVTILFSIVRFYRKGLPEITQLWGRASSLNASVINTVFNSPHLTCSWSWD